MTELNLQNLKDVIHPNEGFIINVVPDSYYGKHSMAILHPRYPNWSFTINLHAPCDVVDGEEFLRRFEYSLYYFGVK